ncbi:MAG: hypothetical protein WA113_10980 [Desulfitobacteriaceae bacterium]
MKERVYNIAGVFMKVVSNQINVLPFLKPFLIGESSYIDLEIVTKPSVKIAKPEGLRLVDEEAKWVCNSEGYYDTSIYCCAGDTEEIICRADANQDWSCAEITYLENSSNQIDIFEVSSFLCEILFRNRALFKQGMAIHASAISWEGQGIIFTAPSGTGKSTQAELWAEHMHALVLNDDRPILRLENEKTYVHGTPWSGKKMLFRNESAPLVAIILLEQAAENTIARLPVSTAVAKILPRCFLPYYDKQIMSMCLNNLGEMLSRIPVYLLKCRQDREAVELVYQQCLKNR